MSAAREPRQPWWHDSRQPTASFAIPACLFRLCPPLLCNLLRLPFTHCGFSWSLAGDDREERASIFPRLLCVFSLVECLFFTKVCRPLNSDMTWKQPLGLSFFGKRHSAPALKSRFAPLRFFSPLFEGFSHNLTSDTTNCSRFGSCWDLECLTA